MKRNKPLSITEQEHFFNHQLQAMEDEYSAYLNGNMNRHFKHGEAFLGTVVGFDSKRANLLVKFKKNFSPRLEFVYQGSLFSGVAGNINELSSWSFSVKNFYQIHIRMSSEMFTVFSMPSDEPDSLIVAFKDVDTIFLEKILPAINNRKYISIAIIQNPPPYRYLINLKNFVSNNQDSYLLNLYSNGDISTWKPKTLTNEDRVDFIDIELERCKELIIQGPPGTGKSHLISQLCDRFLDKQLRVGITSLTNKTLIEICSKSELKSACLGGKIYKTSLKENERLALPGLKLVTKQLQVTKGELLLSTFYALAEAFSDNVCSNVQLFDVLIVEEASQAFLPTIAAFKQLADKMLLVGDPMQMAPIVLNKEQLIEKNKNYTSYIAGLSSIAINTKVNGYFLDKTYRLSPAAAKQTGVFYHNRLISQQPDSSPLKVSSQFQKFISTQKASHKYCNFELEYPDQLKEAISLSIKLVENLMALNPEAKFAILSPYRKIVSSIQDSAAANLSSTKNLLIETIDRIQGITVDYCILLLPLKRVSFELNKERFNVATSRSTNGTLIFISDKFIHYSSISEEVRAFLGNSKTIKELPNT